MLYAKLISHFIGNGLVWILNLGQKSYEEVAQKDNSWIGFIILLLTFLTLYSKT